MKEIVKIYSVVPQTLTNQSHRDQFDCYQRSKVSFRQDGSTILLLQKNWNHPVRAGGEQITISDWNMFLDSGMLGKGRVLVPSSMGFDLIGPCTCRACYGTGYLHNFKICDYCFGTGMFTSTEPNSPQTELEVYLKSLR